MISTLRFGKHQLISKSSRSTDPQWLRTHTTLVVLSLHPDPVWFLCREWTALMCGTSSTPLVNHRSLLTYHHQLLTSASKPWKIRRIRSRNNTWLMVTSAMVHYSSMKYHQTCPTLKTMRKRMKSKPFKNSGTMRCESVNSWETVELKWRKNSKRRKLVKQSKRQRKKLRKTSLTMLTKKKSKLKKTLTKTNSWLWSINWASSPMTISNKSRSHARKRKIID